MNVHDKNFKYDELMKRSTFNIHVVTMWFKH